MKLTQTKRTLVLTLVFLAIGLVAHFCRAGTTFAVVCIALIVALLELFKPWRKTLLVLAVVAALVPIATRAQNIPTIPDQTAGQTNSQPQLGIGPCIAAGCIIVGGWMVYELWKTCKNIFNDNRTNSPPPPPPPPPGPPSTPSTNHASKLTLMPMMAGQLPCAGAAQYSATNTDRYGAPYSWYFWFFIDSTTNLLDWANECVITGWVSAASYTVVGYHTGAAYVTNSWPVSPNGQTNNLECPFVATDNSRTKLFRFRY